MQDFNNKELGKLGEDLAEDYIKNCGYKIIQRNFRCRTGEIDIIAADKGYIVFVEVKTRRTSSYGAPCEAVNYHKINKIISTSYYYIAQNRLQSLNTQFRFDVAEVVLSRDNNLESLTLIKNAFQL